MSFTLLGVGRWVAAPRPGRRKGGFPPGGPWDLESFNLACALAGTTEAFELDTGRITFTEPEICAVVGAERGELGECKVIESSRRLYLARVASEPSPSQGGEGRVRWGNQDESVSKRPEETIQKDTHLLLAHPPQRTETLRILPGPQSELLPSLSDRDFVVDRLSDRTGLRLSKTDPHPLEIPSEPATFGAIQLTPNGTPIVLGPDGPTLGGYPKPAVVIRADRDFVGRLMPGDTVRFVTVTRAEAEAAWAKSTDEKGQKQAQIALGLNARGFRTS